MKKIPFIAILVLSVMLGSFGVITSCRTTLEMPEDLNDKCKIAWALLIAFHESSKNDATKAAVAVLLNSAQTECYKSIDTDKTSLKTSSSECKKKIYGDKAADLSDKEKRIKFLNCIKIKEGIILKED